jgi:ribosomal protein L34E
MKIYERVESLYKCTECGMRPNKWILIANCFTTFSGIRMKMMVRPYIGVLCIKCACVQNFIPDQVMDEWYVATKKGCNEGH